MSKVQARVLRKSRTSSTLSSPFESALRATHSANSTLLASWEKENSLSTLPRNSFLFPFLVAGLYLVIRIEFLREKKRIPFDIALLSNSKFRTIWSPQRNLLTFPFPECHWPLPRPWRWLHLKNPRKKILRKIWVKNPENSAIFNTLFITGDQGRNFPALNVGIRQNSIENAEKTINWLIDWSIDWSIDWLIDRLIGWLIDWLVDWLIDWLIGLHTQDYGLCD